jgi:uncharacterized membrane protein (UPF0136 family)
MYDFCFSPIYAVLLAIGGVAGYVTKGSMTSLGAGLGSAALLGLMSKWSLHSYHKGKACKPATAISLLVAAGLTYVMYERYSATGKLMPAGLTAGLSAAMTGGLRAVHALHVPSPPACGVVFTSATTIHQVRVNYMIIMRCLPTPVQIYCAGNVAV